MTADAVGGVWTYAIDLARELTKRDVEVHIATMGRPPAAEGRSAAEAAGATLHIGNFPLEWEPSPWEGVDAAGEWLLELGRELRPDVIHLNGYVHAAMRWKAPTVVVAHSDVLSWHRRVTGESAGREWGLYAERVGKGLRAAGAIVAPSRAVVHDLKREYALDGWVTVIPNFRAPDVYAPGEKEEFVLGVGRLWDQAKNARLFSRIAGGTAWPIRLAGESDDGLKGVKTLGRLAETELAEQYARAAIYAHPALYEPFGLSILEAAMSGCALVLSDISSLKNNWGDAALFASPRDDKAWTKAIRSLIENEPLRKEMGEKAIEAARQFSAERTVDAYLKVYSELEPVPA